MQVQLSRREELHLLTKILPIKCTLSATAWNLLLAWATTRINPQERTCTNAPTAVDCLTGMSTVVHSGSSKSNIARDSLLDDRGTTCMNNCCQTVQIISSCFFPDQRMPGNRICQG
ncbi:uncharacterized protein LOC144103910 isoform X2 [Amblyomma americanum]